MNLEDQVASVEPSKELAELGVKQDSTFWWVEHIKSGTNYYIWDLLFDKDKNDLVNKHLSAYTVAELGEMLPGRIKTAYNSWNYLHITKLENTNEWLIAYYNDELKGSSEADARAKMLIYLIKEGLVKVEEVGK